MVTIYLDAGHYDYYNRSPVVPEYWESKMNWSLHLKLKAELEKYEGITVLTTRADQKKDLTPVQRGMCAKDGDILLSLHSNAANKESTDFVVIFVPLSDADTDIDEKSRALAKKLAPKITEVMGVTQKDYEIYASRSANDRNGDGILNDNHYGVLHGARQVNVPALIIEHSFHTNKRSTEWLLVDENLQRLAEEEAKIIAEHYGCKLKEAAKKKIWRVQVGAYLIKSNATKQQEKLKNTGYSGFITKVGLYYKVQVGAFEIKNNAINLQNKLKAAGFSTYLVEAYI